MFKQIGKYIDLYGSSKEVQCSNQEQLCDSIFLGTLIRTLQKYNLPIDQDTYRTIRTSSSEENLDIPTQFSLEHIEFLLNEIRPPKYVFLDKDSSGCCSKLSSCRCSKVTLSKMYSKSFVYRVLRVIRSHLVLIMRTVSPWRNLRKRY